MRKSTGTLNGCVMANGLPCGPDFRRISAYVPQACCHLARQTDVPG